MEVKMIDGIEEIEDVEEEETVKPTKAKAKAKKAVDTKEPVEDEDLDVDFNEDEELATGFSLDDFDDSEEVWEGGPTVGQAKEWKKLYGRLIIGTLDNGDHYMIRPINRFEYRQHVAQIEELSQSGRASNAQVTMTNEEGISAIGLVSPTMDKMTVNSGLAGLPSLISQQIMEISGFMAIETREL